ncbi:MFS transporter [Sphingomonas abietis]|uniref:MFS transporter n=1 Tax=Sphingomonas abietis TaxID=3012344 RepID=A0ABY7NK54_9SPHN|nr:MFS transporter [Sphingomonas abietis]WBO21013.1 MFS transporter [Sphingomonas abietis]
MDDLRPVAGPRAASGGITPAVTIACAVACGVIVANLYYAQPLIALIAPELHLGANIGGLIVTLTMFGYAAGLLLIVPLADRIENRRLILATIAATALALAGLAAAPSAVAFLIAAMLVGFCSSGCQIVVPFAAALAPHETRGATIGNVMSGLLAGIMLSRPVASLIAEVAGWRAVFGVSAVLMVVLGLWLARALPERRPTSGQGYGHILRSMGHILLRERKLQRRAAYQGFVFAIFNIFWTSAPLLLADRFGFHQTGIALFALAGAAGALTAPIAGRLGDKGYIRLGTAAALLTITVSCLLAGWSGAIHSLALLVVFALTLDGATQINQVLGQRVIFSLPGEDRGRVNAVYMTILFVLGASGSAIATLAYHAAGWWGAMGAGAVLGSVVTLLFATEWLERRGQAH